MQRKPVFLLILLLIFLAASCGLAADAAAQEGENGFTETFENPQLPDWEHSPGALVTGGVLRVGPANFAAYKGRWQDFDLRARLRCSGPGDAQVHYRASDAGFYQLSLGESEILLLRISGQGEPAELARAAAAQLAAGQWIELGVTSNGGEHTVTLDNTPVLTAGDPDPLPPGTVIIAAHGERTIEVASISLQTGGREPAGGGEGGGEESAPAPAPPAEAGQPGTPFNLVRLLAGEQGSTFKADVFVINLLLAMAASFALSRAYVYWGKSLSNRRKFAANFMMIAVTTTFIILVVRSSVALSLGLVGALSIIRFRAAIKEPEELAYLFMAIALGIGLGDNQRVATLLALGVVIALIGLSHLFRQTQADVNLHLTLGSRSPHKLDVQQVTDLLGKHCAKLRLLRYDQNDEVVEMTFVVEFRHTSDLNRARVDLEKLVPSVEISFLDNKGVW